MNEEKDHFKNLTSRRYRCLVCGNETYFTRRHLGVIRDPAPGCVFNPKRHGDHCYSELECECGSKKVRWLKGAKEPSRVKEA